VTLTFDHERHDRYGRTLAYVTLADGRLLNRLLLEEGHAIVYRRFDFRLKNDFLAAEERARGKGAGMWRGAKKGR
jgi:micrococcal nuclease